MLRLTACMLLCATLLGGCASLESGSPQRPDSPQVVPPATVPLGRQIAEAALQLLGRPYQFGGNGPDAFDCSGLVRFVHGRVGIDTPRTTARQFLAARPVDLKELAAGDLLFFKISAQPVSHVAIYAGEGVFVHAPQTGRPVEVRGVDEPFYRSRLVKVGRLY